MAEEAVIEEQQQAMASGLRVIPLKRMTSLQRPLLEAQIFLETERPDGEVDEAVEVHVAVAVVEWPVPAVDYLVEDLQEAVVVIEEAAEKGESATEAAWQWAVVLEPS